MNVILQAQVKNSMLPLHDPHHFLYGKLFGEQCTLIISSSDPYELFGLSPLATKREITRVYQHLALHFHPDHHQGALDLATKAMQKINTAKAFLDSPNSKKSSASVFMTSSDPVLN